MQLFIKGFKLIISILLQLICSMFLFKKFLNIPNFYVVQLNHSLYACISSSNLYLLSSCFLRRQTNPSKLILKIIILKNSRKTHFKVLDQTTKSTQICSSKQLLNIEFANITSYPDNIAYKKNTN